MKSITIHKLSDDVAKAIEEISTKTGLSQNKVIKRLLKKALGLQQPMGKKETFDEFLGIWDDEESKAFEKAIEAFEQIDEGLWK